MKRFHFSLERVLKLKEQRQKLAEQHQRQALMAVEVARTEVASLQNQLVRKAEEIQGKLSTPLPSGEWIARYQHTAFIERAIERAELQVQQAVKNLVEANTRRRQITTEVEALLHLRQQQWVDHAEETMHQDQIQLDDVGMRRWQLAKIADKADKQAARAGDLS
jgi:flagellar FliJ protein